MSSNGFVNWIQKNPGTAFAIFLVFAAIVTIIVMVTMRPTASAGPGAAADIPVLNVSGTKVVKSTKVSGYAMKYEYAIGEYLGDNIDFTITIDIRSGFDQKKINRLKVFRYKLNAADEKDGAALETKIIDGIKNFTERSVTFVGQENTYDAVSAEGGKQYFEVIGYVVDANGTETEYMETNPLAKTPTGDLVAPKISKDDLNYVLTEDMSVPFEWTVADAAILDVGRSDPTRTKYFLSIDPSKQVALIPDPVVDNTYKFKYDDNTFFTVGGIDMFTIDQPVSTEKKYFLYTTDTQGVKVMVTRVGGTGALVLMDPREMTGKEYEAARIGITEDTTPPPPPPVIPPPAPVLAPPPAQERPCEDYYGYECPSRCTSTWEMGDSFCVSPPGATPPPPLPPMLKGYNGYIKFVFNKKGRAFIKSGINSSDDTLVMTQTYDAGSTETIVAKEWPTKKLRLRFLPYLQDWNKDITVSVSGDSSVSFTKLYGGEYYITFPNRSTLSTDNMLTITLDN